jgi:hypothetical protein
MRHLNLVLLAILMGVLFFAAPLFAFDLDPRTWIKGLGDMASGGVWVLICGLLGWLFKVKIEAAQLRQAVSNIKNAVDSVRMAHGANSPGGTKVTIGEAVGIAEKSLTSILATLRTLKPQWIPHWVEIDTNDVK